MKGHHIGETPERDNTEERQKMNLTDAQIGWLAGIVDGEGNLQLCQNAMHIRAKVIVLTNTSGLLIQAVSNLLTEAGIEHRIQNLSRGPGWKKQWKTAWNIEIGKVDHMKAFLALIHPHLVEKKVRCEIVAKFLERRRSYKPRRRMKIETTEGDLLLASQMRALNRRGASESVETVRGPRESVKIQSELRRDAKRLAEMTNPRLFN